MIKDDLLIIWDTTEVVAIYQFCDVTNCDEVWEALQEGINTKIGSGFLRISVAKLGIAEELAEYVGRQWIRGVMTVPIPDLSDADIAIFHTRVGQEVARRRMVKCKEEEARMRRDDPDALDIFLLEGEEIPCPVCNAPLREACDQDILYCATCAEETRFVKREQEQTSSGKYRWKVWLRDSRGVSKVALTRELYHRI